MFNINVVNRKISQMSESNEAHANFAPELQFLLLECQKTPSVEQDRKAFAIISNAFDFSLLCSLAIKNELCPILAKNLRRLELSPKELKPVFSIADAYRLRSVHYSAELARVFRLFKNYEIRALLLKGPALAQQIYGSVALRFSNDLDILVDPARYEEARSLLLEKGYSPLDHVTTDKRLHHLMKNPVFHHTALSGNGVGLELHWKSLDLEPISFEKLFQRCYSVSLFDTEIPVLSMPDTLLLLTRHGWSHSFELKWLIDLFELLQKSDNTVLGQFCAEFANNNSLYAFYAFLLLVKQLGLLSIQMEESSRFDFSKNADGSFLLKGPLKSKAFKISEQLCSVAFHFLTNASSEKSGVSPRNYSFFLRRIRYKFGLANRYEEFFKLISPGIQEFELINLPDALFFLYYPIRIGYWIWRRVLRRQSWPD